MKIYTIFTVFLILLYVVDEAYSQSTPSAIKKKPRCYSLAHVMDQWDNALVSFHDYRRGFETRFYKIAHTHININIEIWKYREGSDIMIRARADPKFMMLFNHQSRSWKRGERDADILYDCICNAIIAEVYWKKEQIQDMVKQGMSAESINRKLFLYKCFKIIQEYKNNEVRGRNCGDYWKKHYPDGVHLETIDLPFIIKGQDGYSIQKERNIIPKLPDAQNQ